VGIKSSSKRIKNSLLNHVKEGGFKEGFSEIPAKKTPVEDKAFEA
jgi:hypothetical protein